MKTSIVTSDQDGPEEFRHCKLYVVCVRINRFGKWQFIAATDGESHAKRVAEAFTSNGVEVFISKPQSAYR